MLAAPHSISIMTATEIVLRHQADCGFKISQAKLQIGRPKVAFLGQEVCPSGHEMTNAHKTDAMMQFLGLVNYSKNFGLLWSGPILWWQRHLSQLKLYQNNTHASQSLVRFNQTSVATTSNIRLLFKSCTKRGLLGDLDGVKIEINVTKPPAPQSFKFDLCNLINCGPSPRSWRGYDGHIHVVVPH